MFKNVPMNVDKMKQKNHSNEYYVAFYDENYMVERLRDTYNYILIYK